MNLMTLQQSMVVKMFDNNKFENGIVLVQCGQCLIEDGGLLD